MSRNLYPKISVYQQEWFSVDDSHQLYVEQSGNPEGIPVVYLHGGPGGGSSVNHRRYFDPEIYRIIVFDQRGCGRSKPSPSIDRNTTQDLVADLEKIRLHLAIDKWLVAGGSWGTTLALVYGIEYANSILGFILRGVFLATQAEYNWLYSEGGAQRFFPEYYNEFIRGLSENERENPLEAYYHKLTSKNEVAAIAASKAWYLWELRLSTIEHHQLNMLKIEDAHQALCMAKISSHYFNQHCFIPENYIINNIDKIKNIPAIILHGRYDMVCQLTIADTLVKHWANAQLHILPCAGHSGFEQQTIDAFCKATDTMAHFLNESTK
ncbi:MAG: prolyl aminopeptidase [Colwellia sp.]|nr:prolyl aminopeptidase [Colwellia sp.]